MRKFYETNWFNDIFILWLVWEKCVIIEGFKTTGKTFILHSNTPPQTLN